RVTADLDLADLIAPMNRRLHVLAPRLDPLAGLSRLHRNPTEQRLLRIDVQLRAEAAADLRRDDAQFVFRHADHERELRAQEVRNLRRRPDGEFLFARQITREHAARLDRHGRETLIDDALLDDVRRRSERRFDVALARRQLISDVVAKTFVDDWAALTP